LTVIVKNHIENLHDWKIKTIVLDRGGEFVNNQFKKLAETNGFIHILSPPETPQHNWFAERANRTIIEKARCILNRSNLPKSYWAEAVSTATFLLNIIPTPSRSNNSPYAIWKGFPPRIKRLRVFGCQAVILIPKSQQDWKFDAVGAEGVFLGYKNDNTTYCILRLSDLKVVISKHVKFEENVFPCIQAPFLRDEAWIIPWNNQLESTEMVDEFHQSGYSLIDEIQMNDLFHSVEDSSRLVDEAQESSSGVAAVEMPVPVNRPRIKVIGPRHPTLIKGSVDSGNILPYNWRPKTLFTALAKSPRTYNQAIKSPNKESWRVAIDKELSSMNRLHVWDVGFPQTPSIDFEKTYAPTGRLNSLRCLISYAASRGLKFHQIDIKSAFLNAPLSEVVYLSVPQGLDLDRQASCLCLNKDIYGLKQAPLAWYQRLKQWLLQAGFSACVLNPCVFFRSRHTMTWLYIHVDHIPIFGEDVYSFIKEISQEFDIKDMGPADLMLGIRVMHGDGFISLDQSHFTESLLDLYGLSDFKCVATPLEPNVHLQLANDEEVEKFLSLGFLERPGIGHWNGFLHMLQYLKGTQNVVLVYSQGLENEVRGYSNADWGNCRTTLHEDNQSCINTANGDCNLNNKRMKHVDIQLHFIKEAVRDSIVNLIYTPTSLMLADFLTKSVCRPILSQSMKALQIVELGVMGDVGIHDLDQDDCQSSTPRSTNAQTPLLENQPNNDQHVQITAHD
ncbi:hypothetical protein O181_076833, partial [Austropuccinia psidii MF-1]|nr:hypothetical protein [Austropuccinia psidii MF-1]